MKPLYPGLSCSAVTTRLESNHLRYFKEASAVFYDFSQDITLHDPYSIQSRAEVPERVVVSLSGKLYHKTEHMFVFRIGDCVPLGDLR